MSADDATAKLRLEVEVETTLADVADSSSTAGQTFIDVLKQRLDELTRGFGLPLETTIEVTFSDAEGAELYRVRVDRRQCELRKLLVPMQDPAPEELAREVARTIVYNRELLVGPELAERLRREWAALNPGLTALSQDEFQAALAQLLRCCVNVAPRRLDDLQHDPDGVVPLTPDRVCELALQGWAPSFHLFVAANFGDALDPDVEAPVRPYTHDVKLAIVGLLLQEILFDELGLVLPTMAVEIDSALGDDEFRIAFNDLAFPRLRSLAEDEAMVSARPEMLVEQGFADVRQTTHPTVGSITTVLRIDDAGLARLEELGFATWGREGLISLLLAGEIRRHAGAFLSVDAVTFRLHQLSAPIVTAALHRFDTFDITAVLRHLLHEQVSIRDLGEVLEAMVAVDGGVVADQSRFRVVSPNLASVRPVAPTDDASAPGPDAYADCARRHLRWLLTAANAAQDGSLQVLTVDERIEARIRRAGSEPLNEQERERLLDAVWAPYESALQASIPAVVLTNSEVRGLLRSLLQKTFPSLLVLSRDEVAPGTSVKTLNRIMWA